MEDLNSSASARLMVHLLLYLRLRLASLFLAVMHQS
jgi:hypothetical protein